MSFQLQMIFILFAFVDSVGKIWYRNYSHSCTECRLLSLVVIHYV